VYIGDEGSAVVKIMQLRTLTAMNPLKRLGDDILYKFFRSDVLSVVFAAVVGVFAKGWFTFIVETFVSTCHVEERTYDSYVKKILNSYMESSNSGFQDIFNFDVMVSRLV